MLNLIGESGMASREHRATRKRSAFVAAVLTVVIDGPAAADPISVGPIDTGMTFDEMQAAIAPGKVECVKWSGSVEWGCTLEMKTAAQAVLVWKDPSGRTMRIRRSIPTPTSLSKDDVFRQMIAKYGALGELAMDVPFHGAIILGCPGSCTPGNAAVTGYYLKANAQDDFAGQQVLIVYVDDDAALNANNDRIDREMTARKPELPL